MQAPKNTLERIARDKLDLETLERRNSDELDFHDLAVWTLQAALEEAYKAGFEDGQKDSQQ